MYINVDNKDRNKLKLHDLHSTTSVLYNSINNINNNINKTLKSRVVTVNNDLVVCDRSDNVLIIDSGCDQSIISISSFVIGCRTGIKYSVDGALDDMKSKAPLEVVNRCVSCCTINTNKTKNLLQLDQSLLYLSNQSESLL